MTTRHNIFYIIIVIILTNISCQPIIKNSMQTGTWSKDGRIFKNEWINLCVIMPEGYRALSQEEIQEAVGLGGEILINDGIFNKQTYNLSKILTVYDFFIIAESGIPNFILLYENIGIQSILNNFDEEGYYNEVKKNLEKLDTLTYECIGKSIKNLAGDKWLVGSFHLTDSGVFQDYYLKKIEKTMVVFIITYTDIEMVDKFISSISKIK